MNSNYFPHDSNARNSDKIIKLRMRHKAAGYGVFFMILERLRESTNYMSVKDYNVIAFDLREDASLIKSVIEDFGLFVFTDDGKYFYSESMTERMKLKDEIKEKRSAAGRKGMESRWGSKTEPTLFDNDSYNTTITNVINEDNNKENKKEKKENTTKVVQKKSEQRFSPPTIEQLKEYICSNKYNVDAERFFNFYQSKGWYVGKNKMKDWKAAVRTWVRGNNDKSKGFDVGITLTNNSTDKYNDEERWNR